MRVLVPLEIEDRAPALGARLHETGGRTMGTGWRLRWAASPATDRRRVRAAAVAELDRVVRQMSHWSPDSDLSRYGALPAGAWMALPDAFAEVMTCALDVARDSDGAFDPASGALVEHWGFGPAGRFDATDFVPPDAPSAVAAGRWRSIALDRATGRLLQPGGARLDLSAIAKGHAVDRIAGRLDAMGLRDWLVEVGGELRGRGLRPDGQPWWVDVEPADGGAVRTRIALHGLSIATSGDARACYTDRAGRRRSHTLDPRTGEPIAHDLASVSVVHAECMRADAWSTALLVLGPDAGMELAARRGLAALFARRGPDGGIEERLSPAMAALAD